MKILLICLALACSTLARHFPEIEVVPIANLPSERASAVALDGSLAYVNGSYTVRIFDISVPRSPVLVGSFNTTQTPTWITPRGQFAYIALGGNGIQILDVSRPGQAVSVGTIDTPGWAQQIGLTGDLACVADYAEGLRVIDVSDPSQPRSLGSLLLDSPCERLEVDGRTVYAATGTSLCVIDISDPSVPRLIGTTPLPASGFPYDTAIMGNRIFVATGNLGLVWFDVSDPTNPREGGRIARTTLEVCAHNSVVLVHGGSDGVAYDFSIPTAPEQIGRYSPWGWRAAFDGHRMLVSSFNLFEVVVANPQRQATVPTPSIPTGMFVAAGKVFVAGNFGLRIYDVTQASEPALIGTYANVAAEALSVDGDLAIVLSSNGLIVLDVSDPSNAELTGGIALPEGARDLVVENSLAFIANADAGVNIVDLSDPANPTLVGSYDTPRTAWRVALEGTRLYVADSSSVQILDVSNPSAPAFLSSFSTGSASLRIAVSASVAFVVTSSSAAWMEIYDVSELSNIRQVSRYGVGTVLPVSDVAVIGTIAYVARPSGIEVLDVSNPTQLQAVGRNTMTRARRVHLAENRLYVTGDDYSFSILDQYQAPDGRVRLRAEPANRAGNFGFQLTGPQGTQLRIQRANSLDVWRDWRAVDLGPGAVNISDTNEVLSGQSFYRAVAP